MLTTIRSLIGYATNLTRFGLVFHIQTEDSGSRYAHIDTHLFSEGGQVIHTLRHDYAQHLSVNNLTEKVIKAMRLQHRQMCRLFESGKLDDALRTLLHLPEDARPGPETRRMSRVAPPHSTRPHGPPSVRPSSVRPSRRASTAPGPSSMAVASRTEQGDAGAFSVPRAPRVPDFGSSEEPSVDPRDTASRPEFEPGTPAGARLGPDQSVETAQSDDSNPECEPEPSAARASSTGAPPSSHDWDAAVDAARRRMRRFGR